MDKVHERLATGLVMTVGDGKRIGGDHLELVGQRNPYKLGGDGWTDVGGVNHDRVSFAELDFGHDLVQRVFALHDVLLDAVLEVGAVGRVQLAERNSRLA